MKKFILFLIFTVIALEAFADKIPSDKLYLGDNTSADYKEFIFDIGLGASNPTMKASLANPGFAFSESIIVTGTATLTGNLDTYGTIDIGGVADFGSDVNIEGSPSIKGDNVNLGDGTDKDVKINVSGSSGNVGWIKYKTGSGWFMSNDGVTEDEVVLGQVTVPNTCIVMYLTTGHGGGCTSGIDNTRALNTIVPAASCTTMGISLGSNQITFSNAKKYIIEGFGSCYQTNQCSIFFYNTSDSSIAINGSQGWAINTHNSNDNPHFFGRIDLTGGAPKTFELRGRCQVTQTNGFGFASLGGTIQWHAVKIKEVP